RARAARRRRRAAGSAGSAPCARAYQGRPGRRPLEPPRHRLGSARLAAMTPAHGLYRRPGPGPCPPGEPPPSPLPPMGSRSALRHKLASPPVGDPDPVLDAMARELRRSMEGFDVPGSPRPYYMAYALRRVHTLRLRAAYGSLLRSRDDQRAAIYCEV